VIPASDPQSIRLAGTATAVLALLLALMFASWKVDDHYITRREFQKATEAIEHQVKELRDELRAYRRHNEVRNP